MLAKALMSFSADNYGIFAHKDDIIEILDPNVFLDLEQAKFVKQVDRINVAEDDSDAIKN
jgi:hypothetical protein